MGQTERGLLLAAKVTTFSAVVAVASLVSCVCAFFICQALLAQKYQEFPSTTRACCGP